MFDESKLVDPTSFARRSPLYRLHLAQGANFIQCGDSAIVANYKNGSSHDMPDENTLLASCALLDLTPIPRIGFKGAGTMAVFEGLKFPVPDEANFACPGNGDSLVARLSQQELLVLDLSLSDNGAVRSLRENWRGMQADNSFLLERAHSHAWFALTGRHAAEVLTKVCGVDMRLHKFENYQVAQTSVARSNAIVIRVDKAGTPCFFVLSDLSSSEFLWECLLDAMIEFKGKPVGLLALQARSQN